jgi:hypothetical protein
MLISPQSKEKAGKGNGGRTTSPHIRNRKARVGDRA